jgi:hypothetical protein
MKDGDFSLWNGQFPFQLAPDFLRGTYSWIDESVCDEKDKKIGKVGYEIPFTRFFYKYVPPREPEVIQSDIKQLEKEIQSYLQEL